MRNEWNAYSLVDTNMLVYAIDPSNGFKHEIANELLESLLFEEGRLAVSTQILSETLNVFTLAKMETAGVNFDDVYTILSDVIALSKVPKLVVSPQTILKAAKLHVRFGVDFYDALIAATMKENGITTIYSEDKEFEKIDGIKVMNPFKMERKE